MTDTKQTDTETVVCYTFYFFQGEPVAVIVRPDVKDYAETVEGGWAFRLHSPNMVKDVRVMLSTVRAYEISTVTRPKKNEYIPQDQRLSPGSKVVN
jgi:hypothetical protein